MTKKKLPQDVWEAVTALASAMKRKAPADELARLSAALRHTRRRHGLTHDDVGSVQMDEEHEINYVLTPRLAGNPSLWIAWPEITLVLPAHDRAMMQTSEVGTQSQISGLQ
jgi:hypothetical protein